MAAHDATIEPFLNFESTISTTRTFVLDMSITTPRMKSVNMSPEYFGGHSLRHACATELLRKGTGLREIADFLAIER